MQLLTNWFSPFARKVALALDYKGLRYETIDGLALSNHELLWQQNSRGEVPVLIDGDLNLSNSAHILAYLEDAYPENPILPLDAPARARARALERLYDTRVDPILVNCSLWNWAIRNDSIPIGLKEAGQIDLDFAFAETERMLDGASSFAFGAEPGLADFALWPHLAAVEPLGFKLDPLRFEKTAKLLAQMKATQLFRDDARHTRNFLRTVTAESIETTKIAWRGDRIEWLLGRGFHDWFMSEIVAGRVIWPIR
jgi:glutathione S-transferase